MTSTHPHPVAARNWASNLAYGATRVVAPRSLDELAEVVRTSERVKALGSRHCFNTIADTDGVHVLSSGLPAEISIDPDRRVVRASGGLRYGDLAPVLQAEGRALANLASLPHISLAGAVATGTHGSGDTVASLAAAVAGVELLTADGELRMFRRGDPHFAGVVVSLGALGFVTALELDIVPAFEVAQTVYERLPLDAVLDDLGAVTGLGYSVSMFHTWREPDVIDQLWVKRRADAAGPAPDDVLGAAKASAKRHPLPGVSADSCTDQLGAPGAWFDRLPHFKLEFTPSNGDELQSEFLVPRRHAVAAIRAMRDLAGAIAPLLQVCELRTVARDDLWLSPACGTDVVGIHFTWLPDQPGVERLLRVIEGALEPLGARPHWGKLFTLDGAAERMPRLYAHWNDFTALRRRLDPRGVFGNDFLSRLGL